jgi:hypothetical protein
MSSIDEHNKQKNTFGLLFCHIATPPFMCNSLSALHTPNPARVTPM